MKGRVSVTDLWHCPCFAVPFDFGPGASWSMFATCEHPPSIHTRGDSHTGKTAIGRLLGYPRPPHYDTRCNFKGR